MYTPGVARVCLAIEESPPLAMDFTSIGNRVAIVTNGTAVLGLGDIGAVAGMPVMEGKAALFHELVGISGVPILIENRDPGAVIAAVTAIAPSFGAIQLEDIAAPECFEIERELARQLEIPVLHDDQHGTAVVALAALRTAMARLDRDLGSAVVGQVGLGAAGLGIARVLIECGATVIGSDLSADAVHRLEDLGGVAATLDDLMARSDVVIATTGVAGLIGPELVREGQIIFALTNPDAEISPEEAMRSGAAFAADGRTINNVLGFPGLFRGALDAGASAFTGSMLMAAAEALAERALPGQLVPDPLDRETHAAVAAAVRTAAEAGGEPMFR